MRKEKYNSKKTWNNSRYFTFEIIMNDVEADLPHTHCMEDIKLGKGLLFFGFIFELKVSKRLDLWFIKWQEALVTTITEHDLPTASMSTHRATDKNVPLIFAKPTSTTFPYLSTVCLYVCLSLRSCLFLAPKFAHE